MRAIILAVAATALAACGGGADADRKADVELASRAGAVKARCDVGSRPSYYVPANTQPLVIGCGDLRASGKRVEFSANAERIAGDSYVCLNPAYRGRGQLGIYIPAVCVRNPVPEKLEIITARVPTQGVRGYEMVVWGTLGQSATGVHAELPDGRAAGALFRVGRTLARDVGAEEPFGVFVVELPVEAACHEATVHASSEAAKMRELIDPRPRRPGPPRWCERP